MILITLPLCIVRYKDGLHRHSRCPTRYVRASTTLHYTATAPLAPCYHAVIDSQWDATMMKLVVLVVILPYTTFSALNTVHTSSTATYFLSLYSVLTDSLSPACTPHTHTSHITHTHTHIHTLTSHRCSWRNQSSGAADSRGLLQDL